MVTIPGRDNTLGMLVFMLPVDTPNSIHVSETQGGTVTLPGISGFSLAVARGRRLSWAGAEKATPPALVEWSGRDSWIST